MKNMTDMQRQYLQMLKEEEKEDDRSQGSGNLQG